MASLTCWHWVRPYGRWREWAESTDVFCPFSARNWVKRCILWQRRSICLRTVWVSLRRGGPMCPPVVGNTNSPKNGREPYGVSAGRTHRSAPYGRWREWAESTRRILSFQCQKLGKKMYFMAMPKHLFAHRVGISRRGGGGPMCPPVVGLWVGGVLCFCRADTQVRPYGRWQEWVESTRRILSFECQKLGKKMYSMATPEHLFAHRVGISP